ncbi:MAG: thioredoxin [Actinomycetota bacterium]|nr:thioredoxin [Actinomycetota bacterium]
MGEISNLTDDNFTREVVESDKPVLVDFWAPWCGPCRVMGPIIEGFAAKYGEKIRVGKLNVDENQTTAAGHEILSIPTLILFVDGKEAKKLVGAVPEKKLEEELADWI